MTTRQRKRSYELEQYHTVSSKLVHLDGDNPRHTTLEREPEIIAKLCDDQLVALATDIAKRGAMSPLEVMGVVEHDGLPGHFIAVEGNRRTCALILLTDPSRAPSTELRATFKRIAQDANIPNSLHVYLFESRTKAHPWIELRHLGAQGGIGTREWDPNAKARASTRSTSNTTAKADILALRILERLLELSLITEEQQAEIPLTTLSRYLNNKTRRAIFGLSRGWQDLADHITRPVEQKHFIFKHKRSEAVSGPVSHPYDIAVGVLLHRVPLHRFERLRIF